MIVFNNNKSGLKIFPCISWVVAIIDECVAIITRCFEYKKNIIYKIQ